MAQTGSFKYFFSVRLSNELVELRAVEPALFGKSGHRKLLSISLAVREVKREGDIGQSAIYTACGEGDTLCPKPPGDAHEPPKEHVRDHAKRWPAHFCGYVGDQVLYRSIEGCR
ncbi:hypothetical protein NL676_021530 [Syzygium grande]|nr:hypothetical protein NL676_021530 [Syzygium grande]